MRLSVNIQSALKQQFLFFKPRSNVHHYVTQQQGILETKTLERDETISFYDQELANYRAMLKRKEQREAGG